jgi:hypothetical protein
MGNESLAIEIVQDPISVIFQTSCEYYELIVPVKLIEESESSRSGSIPLNLRVEMDESLIKI